MEIFLVRHGESTANLDKLVQGQLDSELTKKGEIQAKITADRLAEYEFDYIYSSDLKRAHNTAKYINEHHKHDIIIEPDFREINRGIWQGKKKSDVDFSTLPGTIFEQKVPGGESIIEQDLRVNRALQKIIEKHKKSSEKVLIVAHTNVNRLILKNIFGLNFKQFKDSPVPKNCSLYHIDLSGSEPTYIIENCNKHLENIDFEELETYGVKVLKNNE